MIDDGARERNLPGTDLVVYNALIHSNTGKSSRLFLSVHPVKLVSE